MRYIWMNAGPSRTSINAGKMQKASGKSSFSGIFAAFSSARSCRRCAVRPKNTHRESPMLVPEAICLYQHAGEGIDFFHAGSKR